MVKYKKLAEYLNAVECDILHGTSEVKRVVDFVVDQEIIILEENYRSVTDIVEFNNKWISSIDWQGNRFDKNIVSMRDTDILGKNVFHKS